MKAGEFIKKFGWEKSKMAVNGFLPMGGGMPVFDHNSEDLKRLIESHRLIEEEGGIDKVKDTFIFAYKQDVEELHHNFDYLSDLDEFDLQTSVRYYKNLLRM